MSFIELFLLAVGLSMDAFAVSICAGLTISDPILKNALIIGLYFGIFQAGMPFIGYLAASAFTDSIIGYNHWIAFILLAFLGGKMILESFRQDGEVKHKINEFSASLAQMLPLAIATSIDALAVGLSFALLQVAIIPAVLFIGIVTFIISMIGVKIGNVFGTRFESKAMLAGGVILVLIGLNILLG